jgi:hypothetical protein
MGTQARRRSPAYLVAVAASVAAVVGMGGFALSQGARANRLGAQNQFLTDMTDFARRNNARMTPVGPVSEVASAGVQECYIYGTDVPMPAPGYTYRLWLEKTGSEATFAGNFLPEDGVVSLQLEFDPSTYDQVVVTEEPVGSVPGTPGPTKWESSPQLAAAG